MKILFVIHKLEFADHIAIAYLSAIAKQLNHQTYFCSIDRDDLSLAVDKIRPEIVAYSVNTLGFRDIVEAHQKAIKTHKFISIMGGPHPTFYPETFSESRMNAYCIGEGEYAFRDFLDRIKNGESCDSIENLITKNRANPIRPLIKNLDELPPADRDITIANSYLKNTGKKTFYTTRGCLFQCSYCGNNYYHKLYRGKGSVIRRFNVERVIREMEDVKNKYRMDFVRLGDDCFVWNVDEWLEEFVEKYSKRMGIPFSCYLRFDMVDDNLLKLLKQAGCHSAILSVDSTSKYIRENVLKRKMGNADISSNLKRIREHGINTLVNYMLAIPGSSLQDDFDTMALSRRADVTYSAYSMTVPIRKTELYDYCLEKGFINLSVQNDDMKGFSKKSALMCFNEKEKNIRYNIYLLGPFISKLPFPLYRIFAILIKIIPPNIIFRKIHKYFYEYNITKKIFIIPKGA